LADEAGDPKIDSMHLLLSILMMDHPATSLLADAGLTFFAARQAGVLLEDQELVSQEFERRGPDWLLQCSIEAHFKCGAQHVGSESISPSPEVLEICDGAVEIYRLIGHPQYERCFAWWKTSIREGRPNWKVFTVPQGKGVGSAAAAIEATLAGRSLG
jgi:hypothetical protein